MDQKQFDAVLSDAETRLRRLKTLYEQWFMGIERLEPSLLRKEMEDLLARMRKEQVSNTAQRFRLQQLVQRHVTLSTYWRRIGRQIEEGTYQRDLLRARRRAQRRGAERADDGPELELSYDVDIDVDLADVLEEASRAAEEALVKPQPSAAEEVTATVPQPVPGQAPIAARTFLAPPAAAGQAPKVPPPLAAQLGALDALAAPLRPTPAAMRPVPPAPKPLGGVRVPPLGAANTNGAGSEVEAPSHPPAAGRGPEPLRAEGAAQARGGGPAVAQLAAQLAARRDAGAAQARAGGVATAQAAARGDAGRRSTPPGVRSAQRADASVAEQAARRSAPPAARADAGAARAGQGAGAPGARAGAAPGSTTVAAPAASTEAKPAVTPSPRSGAQRGISPFALPAGGSLRPKPIEPPKPPPPPPALTSKHPAAPQPTAAAKPAQPKPAATPSGGGDFSTNDVERVYTQYLAARQKNAERTDNVKRETLEKTIRGMLPQLEKKHAGKKIDFEVVVKDGKVALKPTAK